MKTYFIKVKYSILMLLTLFCFAYAVINDGKYDYTEKLMRFNITEEGEYRYIVIGSSVRVSSTKEDMKIFTVNGIDYIGATDKEVKPSEDGRYYICYVGTGKKAKASINGKNDWTTQNSKSIALPFIQSKEGSYFYKTSLELEHVKSANMDFLLINNIEFTNKPSNNIPERINGYYYIYYGATDPNAILSMAHVSGKEIDLPARMTGKGNYYFVTSDDLNYVRSSGLKSLMINNEDFTNVSSERIPERIDDNYYIYYESREQKAEMLLLPVPIPIDLPFSKTGTGKFYYSASIHIAGVSSSNMDLLLINNKDYTNQTSDDLPEMINGNYYIYYEASTAEAELVVDWKPILNVKVLLEGGF